MNKKTSIIDRNIPILFVSERHTDVECVNHIHISMEIVIVTEGTLHMTIGGKEYDINAGIGAYIPPFETHMFYSEKKNKCHVLMFSGELVSYFFEFSKKNTPTNHLFAVSASSIDIIDKILPNIHNRTDFIGVEAVLAPLCYDIYHGCTFEEKKYKFDDLAFSMFEYIETHFLEDITLKEVARIVGAHPVTASKIFNMRAGIGFCNYLRYQRCAYAARKLKTTGLTVSQIAYESGFSTIRSFNRSFLSVYGITPTEYRASYADV